jgi:hypothetical protein
VAQAMQLSQSHQQQNAQMAQQAQLAAFNNPNGYQQGLPGGQSLMQQIDNFVCNCVPGRHDMFLRGE